MQSLKIRLHLFSSALKSIYLRQQALFNVLCAYSLYDEDVGYCQGMSEVAALLLMFMNEEVNVKNFNINVSYNLLICLLLI